MRGMHALLETFHCTIFAFEPGLVMFDYLLAGMWTRMHCTKFTSALRLTYSSRMTSRLMALSTSLSSARATMSRILASWRPSSRWKLVGGQLLMIVCIVAE